MASPFGASVSKREPHLGWSSLNENTKYIDTTRQQIGETSSNPFHLESPHPLVLLPPSTSTSSISQMQFAKKDCKNETIFEQDSRQPPPGLGMRTELLHTSTWASQKSEKSKDFSVHPHGCLGCKGLQRTRKQFRLAGRMDQKRGGFCRGRWLHASIKLCLVRKQRFN